MAVKPREAAAPTKPTAPRSPDNVAVKVSCPTSFLENGLLGALLVAVASTWVVLEERDCVVFVGSDGGDDEEEEEEVVFRRTAATA